MWKIATHNNESFPAHVPIFYGKSYDQCIVKMKVIFRYQQDVLEVVNDGVPSLARTEIDVQQVVHRCEEEIWENNVSHSPVCE